MLACDGLRRMAGDGVDGGLSYAFAVANCVSQVSFQSMPERVDAFAVVGLVDSNSLKIAFRAFVKEIAGIFSPALLAVVSLFIAWLQISKPVAK